MVIKVDRMGWNSVFMLIIISIFCNPPWKRYHARVMMNLEQQHRLMGSTTKGLRVWLWCDLEYVTSLLVDHRQTALVQINKSVWCTVS